MSAEVVVHIVDDEEPVRNSLAFLLSISGYAVRVHDSATSFMRQAKGLTSAVLITDLRMPDMSGVDLIKRLRSESITIPAIVITGHGDVPMAVEAMKAGAIDFLEKPFEDDVIIGAVGRAIELIEKRPGTPTDIESICERMAQLSEREHQVMQGVVAGQSNKAIAYNLDISPRTVEVHRANVMAKMNCKSLPELVRMVLSVSEAPQ
ncbi:transcriptional regulatory protein FixJ [Nitratireductor aestuarii]|uniref:Transcriptional regulatory protein FixJ n=1 Tax=Nitratireductor aestuarii TaxID=1735103 RepID=A0A916W7W1_9HYPH|nr:response regulator FixJ [Nitratireductor aestuarii]GGA76324.1 transcriptional regulatory protein FixJ [Nitratireductor aestuarii]